MFTLSINEYSPPIMVSNNKIKEEAEALKENLFRLSLFCYGFSLTTGRRDFYTVTLADKEKDIGIAICLKKENLIIGIYDYKTQEIKDVAPIDDYSILKEDVIDYLSNGFDRAEQIYLKTKGFPARFNNTQIAKALNSYLTKNNISLSLNDWAVQNPDNISVARKLYEMYCSEEFKQLSSYILTNNPFIEEINQRKREIIEKYIPKSDLKEKLLEDLKNNTLNPYAQKAIDMILKMQEKNNPSQIR